MTSLIELAGVVIRVYHRYPTFAFVSKRFAAEGVLSPEITVSVSERDIEREWLAIAAGKPEISDLARRSLEPMLEAKALWRGVVDALPAVGVVLMHGAVVSDGATALMITAPSGVGKTTRARILTQMVPRCFILNGDKPLIRVEGKRLIACDSPWRGKEGYGVQTEMQLSSVFLLRRAKQTTIEEASRTSAFEFLLGQTHMPEKDEGVSTTLRLLGSFVEQARVYTYDSDNTIESALEAWRIAKRDSGRLTDRIY